MTRPVFTRPKEKVTFDSARFLPEALYDGPDMKVVRASFQPGQIIPVHEPDVNVVLYVLSGEGEIVAGDERRKVKEGDLVVVPRRMKRGVRAKTAMLILHIVAPPPTAADHGDMAARIARGEFELPA